MTVYIYDDGSLTYDDGMFVLFDGDTLNPVDITLKSCLYDPSVELVAGYQPIIERGGSP